MGYRHMSNTQFKIAQVKVKVVTDLDLVTELKAFRIIMRFPT